MAVVADLRNRPVLAWPKSGSGGKGKASKTAAIVRTNITDLVPCPECSTGLQDVETCTRCDGTGRVRTDRGTDGAGNPDMRGDT